MVAITIKLVPPRINAMLNKPVLSAYILKMLSTARVHSITSLNTGGRSGRHYPGLPNQSSAPGAPGEPGEPPRTQFGTLAGSHTEPKLTGPLRGEFGETANHAQYLEFGSPEGKIAPRPHLRPALAYAAKATPLPTNIIVWTA